MIFALALASESESFSGWWRSCGCSLRFCLFICISVFLGFSRHERVVPKMDHRMFECFWPLCLYPLSFPCSLYRSALRFTYWTYLKRIFQRRQESRRHCQFSDRKDIRERNDFTEGACSTSPSTVFHFHTSLPGTLGSRVIHLLLDRPLATARGNPALSS